MSTTDVAVDAFFEKNKSLLAYLTDEEQASMRFLVGIAEESKQKKIAQDQEARKNAVEPEHEYYRYPEDDGILAQHNAVAVAYGASDDLLEIGGLLSDEWDIYGQDQTEVLLSNGVRFTMTYDENGVWRIKVLAGHDKVTLDVLPTEGEASTGRYTDYLWIHEVDDNATLRAHASH